MEFKFKLKEGVKNTDITKIKEILDKYVLEEQTKNIWITISPLIYNTLKQLEEISSQSIEDIKYISLLHDKSNNSDGKIFNVFIKYKNNQQDFTISPKVIHDMENNGYILENNILDGGGCLYWVDNIDIDIDIDKTDLVEKLKKIKDYKFYEIKQRG